MFGIIRGECMCEFHPSLSSITNDLSLSLSFSLTSVARPTSAASPNGAESSDCAASPRVIGRCVVIERCGVTDRCGVIGRERPGKIPGRRPEGSPGRPGRIPGRSPGTPSGRPARIPGRTPGRSREVVKGEAQERLLGGLRQFQGGLQGGAGRWSKSSNHIWSKSRK